jgi:hypothetical protein
MSQVTTPRLFNKEYMTGYSGHVPGKNDRFGLTTGNVQRDVLEAVRRPEGPMTILNEGSQVR